MLLASIPPMDERVKSRTCHALAWLARLAAYDDRVDREGLDGLTQAESEEYVILQRRWWTSLTSVEGDK